MPYSHRQKIAAAILIVAILLRRRIERRKRKSKKNLAALAARKRLNSQENEKVRQLKPSSIIRSASVADSVPLHSKVKEDSERTELGLTQSMPSCSFTSAEPPTRIGVDGNNEGDAAGGKVKQELMEEEELKPMLTVTVPPIKEELFEEEYENILEDPLEYDSM